MDEEVRIREDGTVEAVKRKGPSLRFTSLRFTFQKGDQKHGQYSGT